jgi:alpha-galactosidase
MTGALGVGANLLTWSDEQMEEARQAISLYKEIRETVQHGHLYRLRSPRDSQLAAIQYLHRNGSEVVVFAFLHRSIFGSIRAMLRLQGLRSEARYQIEGEVETLSGAALMGRGLPISLCGDYISRLIRIRRVD